MVLIFPSNSSTSIPRKQIYNNSVLTNAMPNPHQGGTTDGNTNFSNNRKLFINTLNSTQSIKNTYNDTTSSSYIERRKANAIGKTATKQGLQSNAPLTYDNVNINTTRQSLRKVRSSGTVAPAKKGAI
tara:strand:- start:2266 stop:2649 length:384 start_codon:yes stop_codon:yes gene_type:complete